MIISWTKPYNGGSATTSALIEIQEVDGTWTEDAVNCDGSDTTIFAAKQCSLLMKEDIRGTPFNLEIGDYIKARITFTNELGDSLVSAETTSPPTVQTEPEAPSSKPVRNVLTAGTTMYVDIAELTGTQTGGSDITSYNVEIDATGTGAGPWTEVVGETTANLDTEVEITGLTAG